MKIQSICIAVLCLVSYSVATAGTPAPTIYQKSLDAKCQAEVLLGLSDADLITYCVAKSYGGENLLKIEKNISETESKLTSLKNQGYGAEHPSVKALQLSLTTQTEALSVELTSFRKGLATQVDIAKATLASLAETKTEKTF